MKFAAGLYEPHLEIREHLIPAGEEWSPRLIGWSLIFVNGGCGYWMQKDTSFEIEAGATLLIGPDFKKGAFRASQLRTMRLEVLPINLGRLIGLFSLVEQNSFAAAAARDESGFKVFPPTSELAQRMRELCATQNRRGASYRLKLLQVFLEAVGIEPKPEASVRDADDAASRLEEFLARTPTGDLVNMRITDVARHTRCGPRHLSRLFHEIFKISFREKITQLRLAKARELLATTDLKIVEVAFESGYQSVSLFSLMFSRQYGLSPGRWRQKYRNDRANATRKVSKPARSISEEPTTPIHIKQILAPPSQPSISPGNCSSPIPLSL
jgi:AraC-like DNA-binding protein